MMQHQQSVETTDELRHWAEALERAIEPLGLFDRVTVLAETDSTQDAAKRMCARPGQIVVAGHQTAGRGRRGRRWEDNGRHGMAMTCVVAAGLPERLAVWAAVAVASAVDRLVPAEVTVRPGIKWPNDVVAGGRKLAGILIEQDSERALVGVGVNVGAGRLSADVGRAAISLAEIGVVVERLDVMRAILEALDTWAGRADREIADAFAEFDAMTGEVVSFARAGEVVTGRVVGINAMRGLSVERVGGERIWLGSNATTRLDCTDSSDEVA